MTAPERDWTHRRGAAALGGMLAAVMVGLFWQARQPYLTTLPAAAGTAVKAQAQRFTCLAIACPHTGDTLVPEVLGNPAAQRYPDCSQSYARNPWDLIAYQGRLYVGLGDSSANAGPVPIYAYTPATGDFSQETTLTEEQIDRFYRFDSQLWIPGDDPRESWRLGNLYRRDAAGRWTKLRSLPRTIHALAMARQGERWFAAVSVTGAVPAGTGTLGHGSAVAISEDAGKHWRLATLGGWRIFDFLQVQGQLYAVDSFPGSGVQRWLDQEQRQAFHSPLYEYVPGKGFGRRTDLTAQVMFPDTPLAGQRATLVERALAWGSSAAYLGAVAVTPGELPQRGLYLAHDLQPGQVRVERVSLPPGALAWDLREDDGQLQVLFGMRRTDGRWENAVWSTTDGQHWSELLRFGASTFARSFARLGDDFYFGLGSLLPPQSAQCSMGEEATGTWLRLRSGAHPASPPSPMAQFGVLDACAHRALSCSSR